MHKTILKIEVQYPKLISKLYEDMVTPMEQQVSEMWLWCDNEQFANI